MAPHDDVTAVVESHCSLQSTPSAISAWPSSPVWVLVYWRGTLSTSHVHTPRPGPPALAVGHWQVADVCSRSTSGVTEPRRVTRRRELAGPKSREFNHDSSRGPPAWACSGRLGAASSRHLAWDPTRHAFGRAELPQAARCFKVPAKVALQFKFLEFAAT